MGSPGRRILSASVLFAAIASACASVAPRVINHQPEELDTDNSAFAPSNTHCVPGPYEQKGRFDCETGPLAQLGCDRIFVEDQLRGLRLPIAVCWKFSYEGLPRDQYFRGPKSSIPLHERFVIFTAGKYQLVRNQSELQNRFSPVDASARALSYAVAATGFQPIFGIKFEPTKRYFVSTLEDTFVTSGAEGFVVHNLVDYEVFGCGPHPTYFVSLSVTKEGMVKELSRVRAFEDPSEDRLCVD